MVQGSFVPWHCSCQSLNVVALFVLKKCNCKFLRLSFETAWVGTINKEGKKWQTRREVRAVNKVAAKVAAAVAAVARVVAAAAAVAAVVKVAAAAAAVAAAVVAAAAIANQSLNN